MVQRREIHVDASGCWKGEAGQGCDEAAEAWELMVVGMKLIGVEMCGGGGVFRVITTFNG